MAPAKKITREQEKYLHDTYYSLKSPVAFASLKRLWNFIRKDGRRVTESQLTLWLREQDAYTSFRPVRRKFPRPKTISPYFGYMFGSDTAYFQSIAEHNDGYKYVCVFIDYFTRFAYTYPMKTLTGVEMRSVLEQLFAVDKPERLHTDSGTEYKNRPVQAFLKREHVEHVVTGSDNKSAISEAYIKRLKLNLYRYMFYKNSYRWVDVLDDFTKLYNSSAHSAIRMSPKDARNAEPYVVWRNQYLPPPRKKTRPARPKTQSPFSFLVGDTVKIATEKTRFTREWQEKFTNETFKIIKRKVVNNIPMYLLEDGTGDTIKGFFYEPEMTKVFVPNDKEYKIEKIVRTRRRRGKTEHLVKFQGFPNKYNEWIAAKDVRKI